MTSYLAYVVLAYNVHTQLALLYGVLVVGEGVLIIWWLWLAGQGYYIIRPHGNSPYNVDKPVRYIRFIDILSDVINAS